MNTVRGFIVAVIGVGMVAFIACAGKLYEDVGPDEIVVIQSPIEGRLEVPQINMGGGQNGQQVTTVDFMNLLTAKTARDLSLDLTLPTKK